MGERTARLWQQAQYSTRLKTSHAPSPWALLLPPAHCTASMETLGMSYSQNIRTFLPIGCYVPTIAHTWACLLPPSSPYSASLWTAKAEGQAMDWKHLLASITGTVDQALLLRVVYL